MYLETMERIALLSHARALVFYASLISPITSLIKLRNFTCQMNIIGVIIEIFTLYGYWSLTTISPLSLCIYFRSLCHAEHPGLRYFQAVAYLLFYVIFFVVKTQRVSNRDPHRYHRKRLSNPQPTDWHRTRLYPLPTWLSRRGQRNNRMIHWKFTLA